MTGNPIPTSLPVTPRPSPDALVLPPRTDLPKPEDLWAPGLHVGPDHTITTHGSRERDEDS